MPYIDPELRPRWDAVVEKFESVIDEFHSIKAGELNYLLTKIVYSWFRISNPSYDRIQAVVGLLECVKQEFYRRVAVPYEDRKKKEEGDVFEGS